MINENRPYKELNDETELAFKSLRLKEGTWKIGGRYIKPYWRVIFTSDNLEYDILLPGLYKTEELAVKEVRHFTSFLRTQSPTKKK